MSEFQHIETKFGLPLESVTSDTGNVKTGSLAIEDGEYSESVPAHGVKNIMFFAVLENPGTGDFVVQISPTATFDVYDEFDTEAIVSKNVVQWSAGEPLIGFFRVKNETGEDMTLYCQKEIN